MIDKELLKKIFKYNTILDSIYYTDRIFEINKNRINKINQIIIIFDNNDLIKNKTDLIKRKNCWVVKSKYYLSTIIYIHKNYIQSIIRQKLINNSLND